MRNAARLLAAFCMIASGRAGDSGQFTYVIEGIVEEITPQGIIVDCPSSDRIGYKRAIGQALVFGYPNFTQVKVGTPVRCFGEMVIGAEIRGPSHFRFLRNK